jgi:predicted ArsR family transcriptional regulator
MSDIPEEMTISIGDAAKELGISVITLRRWLDVARF